MLQDSGIDKLTNDMDMDNVETAFQKTMDKKGSRGAQALGIGFGSGPLDAEDMQMMGSDDFMTSSAMGVEDMDKPQKKHAKKQAKIAEKPAAEE
jgi:hypothetical protein